MQQMRLLLGMGVQRCQLCSSAVSLVRAMQWCAGRDSAVQRSTAQHNKTQGGGAQQTGSTQQGF